ncbi:MAG: CotH kinase family protein [Cryomorphaceae bacterium]
MKRFLAGLWLMMMMMMAIGANAQDINPADGRIFTDTEIPKVKIYMDTDSLEDLYLEENWFNNHEYPATFVWEDSLGTDTLHDIGFRFRGNTSRDKVKKSFKVSFNTYISGRRYHGLKKLNLNAEVNDPSLIRSNTSWRMYREMNVPASRSNHVEVYINDAYYGLYQNCEHINDDWVDERFGDDAGNLYKCSFPADLNFISNNSDDYKHIPSWSDTRTYDLKTNREADNYTNLSLFVAFLNQSSDDDFECGFQDYFNVYNYLKIAAIDVLSGNWDGYIWNVNNFYLYDNLRTGRFEYLPYDLDNTWGVTWPIIDWTTRNIYDYGPDNPSYHRLLYTRLMESEVFRDIFSYHIRTMLEESYNTAEHQAAIEAVHDFITASALEDDFKGVDFGYDNGDFLGAVETAFGNHVTYSLFGFAEARAISAQDQVEYNEIAPIIVEMRENFSDFPQSLKVRVRADGPEWTALELTYSFDGGEEMSLSANTFDPSANFDIEVAPGSQKLTYNIVATGANGLQRHAYCEPRNVYYGAGVLKIYINEVMSSNSYTIADGHGDFDDWIELYNGGETAVNLTGYYLVDKDAAPNYWATPGLTMEPGDFRLFWADDEIEQGSMHTNFKVSSGGEGIYLFQNRPDGIRVIDLVQVPAIPTDISWGRQSDGGLPWVLFPETTPGASNMPVSTDNTASESTPAPYPNPSVGELRWDVNMPYVLYDISGRVVDSGQGVALNVQPLAAGVYMLRVGHVVHKVVRK